MRRTTTRILFLAILASCGREPDFVTSHGIQLFDATEEAQLISLKPQIEATTEILLAEMGRGRDQLHGLEIKVVDQLTREAREKNGLYYGGLDYIELRKMDDCWPKTSFTHELTHHFLLKLENRRDHEHEDLDWWGTSSPHWKAKIEAIETLCPTSSEESVSDPQD